MSFRYGATAFALGSLRKSGQGARTVIGVLIGTGFVILNQTLESSGQLFDLPAWVVGWSGVALRVRPLCWWHNS